MNGEWVKSSFSSPHGCVEVCHNDDGTTSVRDSKTPGGPVTTFTGDDWDIFLKGVRNGEFDRPA